MFQELQEKLHLVSTLTDFLNTSTTSIKYWYILVYKNILINHGSGYNTNTGIFTTPGAGTYAFFFSVQVQVNVRLLCVLMLNGKTVSESLVGKILHFNTGSNMVIIPLEKGDKVWVQTHSAIRDWINWSGEVVVEYFGNSFSGFLIFLDKNI